jgi:hypothetical protein
VGVKEKAKGKRQKAKGKREFGLDAFGASLLQPVPNDSPTFAFCLLPFAFCLL